jgi:hypothetical protein
MLEEIPISRLGEVGQQADASGPWSATWEVFHDRHHFDVTWRYFS